MLKLSKSFARLCIIFLCVLDIVSATYRDEIDSEDGLLHRAKRTAIHFSMTATGLQAVKVLLSGSKPLKTMSTTYRKYEKYGNFDAALKDFYSVQPRHIRVLQKDKSHANYEGVVGDRILLLKENNYFGFTTLDIIEKGLKLETNVDRIIYKVR